MNRIGSVLLLAMAILAGCSRQEAREPLDQVTVQLNWFHQAQFAGLYAAQQQGYYAEEGLAVTLLPRPAPGSDIFTLVLEGTANLGLTSGIPLVTARSQGRPVTAIAAIYRRSPWAFMALAESGIARPHDFPGHSIRALNPGASEAVYRAMMTRLGLDPEGVTPVEAGYDLAPFFAGEIDIWFGYLIDEVLAAREQGHQVNVILPADYGIHDYSGVLFAQEQWIQENPDLILRFLRATLKGWQWAIENAEEAAQLGRQYEPALDPAHEMAVIEASLPLIHTGEDHIGWMRSQIWQGIHDILLEQGLLAGPVDVDEVYTMEFLDQLYRGAGE